MSSIIKRSRSNAESEGTAFRFDELAGTLVGPPDASEIMAQARSEADAIRGRAEAEGRAAGLEAAERVMEERFARRLDGAVAALRAAADQVAAAKAEWLAHWEQTAVHVAVEIAGRLVRRQIEHSPEITLTLVREALELAAGAADVQLRLNPDDYRDLGPKVERIAAELARLGRSQITADPHVTRGGCRVDTRQGSIDQQFEAQLARIEQELL